MKSLRIVFMGTPQFAIPSLKKIYHSHHKLAGIITQPDRPKGRGQRLTPPPVKQFANENNIDPILQPVFLKDPDFIETLSHLNADVFVVVAFRILPEDVFSMPSKGTVNLHPSLLPKFRGAAPINWTIIQGEKVTGVTIIFVKKEIDAGNIILQREVPILPDETAGSLHDRLAEVGANLLMESLRQIENGKVNIIRQNDSLVTKAPKLTKDICHINFNQSAEQVKNWIHGLSPIPAAYAFINNKMVKFFRASIVNIEKAAELPGTIMKVTQNDLWIACNPGVINIVELQLEGHKRLNAEEFLRGYRFQIGEILN